jgi:bifunctional non-homologous end joining protein LigD
MLATLATLPLPAGEWAHEMKWDGVRALVECQHGHVRLRSRNDNDMTVSYPEFRGLADAVGVDDTILDGEIVAFDRAGRPSFSLLQQRMHISKAGDAEQRAEHTPVVFLAFDVVHLAGASVLDEPYRNRRSLLEDLDLQGIAWQTPPTFDGVATDALAVSREHGLEGIVAKRLDSRYQAGRRSRDWLKIKNIRTQEVLVGGWRPGQGRRADTIGSLLLGVPGPDGLEYAGHVGTGFTEEMLSRLAAQLAPLERKTSPFSQQLPSADRRDARWVRPEIVGEVAFAEWTPDHRLRHPAWRGLRPDKDPADVTYES